MAVRLVIAEGTDHVRRMLVDILGFLGFEVVGEARTQDEALHTVQENLPDVVVVGHGHLGFDGIEATRRIRTHGPNPQVILYSSSIEGDLEARAREAGAAACVSRTAGIEALALEIAATTLCKEGFTSEDGRSSRRSV